MTHLMQSVLITASVAWAIGCATHDTTARLEDLGLACDATHPCGDGTACGTCGIGTGQCVAPCSASGAAGCPTGAFCSAAWPGSSTHVCVRECTYDVDCRTPTNNAGLSCNDPYLDPGTSVNDLAICNVDNSIGSVHSCP
jgi:hypothetical protein